MIRTPYATVECGYPSPHIDLGKQEDGIIIYRITTVIWGTVCDGHAAIWGFEDKADLAKQLGNPEPNHEITVMEYRNGDSEPQTAIRVFHEPKDSEPRHR